MFACEPSFHAQSVPEFVVLLNHFKLNHVYLHLHHLQFWDTGLVNKKFWNSKWISQTILE